MNKYDNRNYIKDVPEGTDLPLIICLHGGGGTGFTFEQQLGLSLDAVMVYPYANSNGEKTVWNAGPGFNDNTDDLSWLEGLIEQVKQDEDIDPAKIYLLGHSNGGMMAHRYGSVKGFIPKMFIFNSALVMVEEYLYNGELYLLKSENDEVIPPIGNKDYHSFVFEYRQREGKTSDRSDFRIIGGAKHSVESFKEGLENLGTTLETEVKRFFEL